jgi:hypothetical protein
VVAVILLIRWKFLVCLMCCCTKCFGVRTRAREHRGSYTSRTTFCK